MKYNGIYNNPWERSTVTFPWAYQDDIFTHTELDNIVSYCENVGLERSSTIGATSKEQVEEVRKCDVKFHNRNNETSWIFDRINDVIVRINSLYYGFDLNGYESFQYTSYNSAEEGNYNWHMDMCLSNVNLPNDMTEPRKLSMSLMLNDPEKDFEGGEFQLNMGMESRSETLPFKKGRAIFFPSFLIHRVMPVTKGFRKSLVVWVVGPKFT
jgi:PKHD-type hydroxylase